MALSQSEEAETLAVLIEYLIIRLVGDPDGA